MKSNAVTPIGVEERFLLTACVETYLKLTGRDADEYAELRYAPAYREVEAMQLTWAERMEARYMKQGLAKGLKQGLEQGLERGLEQGLERGLEQGLEQGLERGASLDQLGELADRILEVESLEELGL